MNVIETFKNPKITTAYRIPQLKARDKIGVLDDTCSVSHQIRILRSKFCPAK